MKSFDFSLFRNVLLLATCLTCLPAAGFEQVQGGGVHGGGDSRFYHKKWVLKDLLVKGKRVGNAYVLSPDLRQFILEEVIPLVQVYTGIEGSPYWEYVLSDNVNIRLVDALPCNEPKTAYGCTPPETGITYLHRQNFSRFKNDQKLIAILHQRAHAFAPSPDAIAHEWIEPLMDAITTALRIRDEQQSGMKTLSGQEVSILEAFFSPSVRSRLSRDAVRVLDVSDRTVSRQGGGILISDADRVERSRFISDDSFVGIGSIYALQSKDCHYRHLAPPYLKFNSSIRNGNVYCATLNSSSVEESDVNRPDADASAKTASFKITQLQESRLLRRTEVYSPQGMLIRRSLLDHSPITPKQGTLNQIANQTVKNGRSIRPVGGNLAGARRAILPSSFGWMETSCFQFQSRNPFGLYTNPESHIKLSKFINISMKGYTMTSTRYYALLGLMMAVFSTSSPSQAQPRLPGNVSSTRSYSEGARYTVTPDGGVVRGNERITIGGIVTQIVATPRYIYGLGTDGQIYRMQPYQDWRQITVNGIVVRFSVTRDHELFGIGTDGRLYVTRAYEGWSHAD
jgi:hypothetical protein